VAITPEYMKNKEFTVRLRGYDTAEVRAFLKQAANAYRATIRDGGAEWALSNVSDDLAGLMRVAHDTAQKVIDSTEAEAAETRARADAYSAGRHETADNEADLAVEVLRRTQSQADQVATDCDDARDVLEQAQAEATRIRAAAQVTADEAHAEVAGAEDLRRQRAEAEEIHALAVEAYDEAQAAAATIISEADSDRVTAETLLRDAQERADVIATAAESDARARVEVIREEASRIEIEAEAEARRRVEAILSEGQRRLDVLEATEARLQDRIAAAQAESRALVERLLGPDPTIDLTGDDDDIIDKMTSSMTSNAMEQSTS
jgi:DivIVA domain-containing protein